VSAGAGDGAAPAAVPRDVDASPVAWREAGDGPLVLLLHGLGGSRTAWDPMLVALADRYRCVAWDAPGYGASPPACGAVTFDALADAAAGLLDVLDRPAAAVVGHSLGGMVAQHLALRHPKRVARMVLIATSPRFGLDGTDPVAWRAARLAPIDHGAEPASFAETVLRGVAGPAIDEAALDAQVRAMARVPAAGLRAMIECLVTHDALDRLGMVTAPTLVLVGEHDAETPVSYAAALAERIPGARLEIVPGAGHLLPAEAPGAVTASLLAFLSEGRW
jgi:3-oxoadipate enol-lactonase